MAVAVIVGILFATFLTLVLVPVMYSLVNDLVVLFGRTRPGEEDEDPPADPGFSIVVSPLPASPDGEPAAAPLVSR